MKKNDLTIEALQGFNHSSERYLPTSAAWYANKLGEYFFVTGRTAPHDVSMSRGACIRANGMMFKHTGSNTDQQLTTQVFERLR